MHLPTIRQLQYLAAIVELRHFGKTAECWHTRAGKATGCRGIRTQQKKSLESRVFWTENFWLAFPKQHRLSKFDTVKAKDLPIEELLPPEEGHCFRDHILSACTAQA